MTPKVSSLPERSPDSWTALEKTQAVIESAGLNDDELGQYLRERGLHQADLTQWREQIEGAFVPTASNKSEKLLKKELRRTQTELNRKNRALAETAALLVLSKKLGALWEDEGENT